MSNGLVQECIWDSGGKPRRKIPVGRPRYSYEDNIKMDLREKGFHGMDWTDLPRDVGPVEGSY
jgi:hypothetical protein